ncbi:hypothetical protein F2Q68_00004174 [Brassica cretica]|uniref:Uncharacterized protein n=1 Tax=Brassica cretica TaxID=69181 RepID=A0A3N6TF54_BRACR|nr:hypothetical protein F2Q68_00004174 [Brassica cretica]
MCKAKMSDLRYISLGCVSFLVAVEYGSIPLDVIFSTNCSVSLIRMNESHQRSPLLVPDRHIKASPELMECLLFREACAQFSRFPQYLLAPAK